MAKITFIQGLVASGKSYLASMLEGDGAFKIDDTGFNPTGEWVKDFNRNYSLVKSKLLSGNDCVIVEVHYNQQVNRDEITRMITTDIPGTQIEWIFFANDLETAQWNCFTRYHKGEKNDLLGALFQNFRMAPVYEIPDTVATKPIFKTVI